MAKRILAFAASNSSKSINRQLVTYAASLIDGAAIETLDIHDFEMPLYRSDREEAEGIPQLAYDFLARMKAVDGVLVSFAEHNGAYPAAFKNLFDWCSRIQREFWQNKPIVMLATSPGGRGGKSVLEFAVNAAPRFGGEVVGHLAVPSFYENFDASAGKIANPKIDTELTRVTGLLIESLPKST